MKCNHNIGKTDRTIRLIAGIVIIAVGAYMESWWGAVGIVPLFTGIFRFCPAYCPLGISTDKS